MPVYLNLSELRPLDILLTRGTGKFSPLIRLASALKTRKPADFSHAALILAPSVSVEALTKEGIVCSNLAAPLPNPHAAPSSTVPASDPFSPIWTEGRLQALVRLDGVAAARVLRSRSSAAAATPPTAGRAAALEVLVSHYLRQYTELGRLTQPIIRLPDWLEDLIRRAASPLDGKKEEPGVFCSELVCLLMATTFGREDGAAHRVTPSDLGHATGHLDVVEAAVLDIPDPTSLGASVSDTLKAQLRSWLHFPDPYDQMLKSKILRIMNYLSELHADADRSRSREEFDAQYEERREQLRQQWVTELNQQLVRRIDPVWSWIQDANECRRTCPTRRRAWAEKQEIDEETRSKLASPVSAFGFLSARERRIKDADRCCDTITSCTEVLRTYAALERRHEAYMSELAQQAAARSPAA